MESVKRRYSVRNVIASDSAWNFNIVHQRERRGSTGGRTIADLTAEVPLEGTKASLLAQEDTDGDGNVTVDDSGPKIFQLRRSGSSSTCGIVVQGTYMISNLLQELIIQQEAGLNFSIIHGSMLVEDPVERIRRRITDVYWKNLLRRMDRSLISAVALDEKDWTVDRRPRIYVPHEAHEQYEYYSKLAEEDADLRLEVLYLPQGNLTQDKWDQLLAKPGLLALDVVKYDDGQLHGRQYIVPGGRFNEFYGWDSYFCALGLLECGKVDIAEDIARNFCFEIDNYGCILNGSRTYYLGRSQPPFLTDLAIRVYQRIKHRHDAKDFLKTTILAAIKEYDTVWMSEPRYDSESGLSRYRPVVFGMPPECEETQFDHVLAPYAAKHSMSLAQFKEAFNKGSVEEPQLNEFFMHDRAVRESGHDTCTRFTGTAADLATIDLNSLLYKYETDIANVIRIDFDDRLESLSPSGSQNRFYTSDEWFARAAKRRERIHKNLWNPSTHMFHDYNLKTHTLSSFDSVTCLWALWSGLASPSQAEQMVHHALPKFEALGGLTCSSAPLHPQDEPAKQWDYPSAWAPHQMLAWEGLRKYGFDAVARRLAYRWLDTITRTAVGYNGVIVEKYDVTKSDGRHKVDAEYGNQGRGFRGLAKEGFGWTNASFLCGLKLMDRNLRTALSLGVPAERMHAHF